MTNTIGPHPCSLQDVLRQFPKIANAISAIEDDVTALGGGVDLSDLQDQVDQIESDLADLAADVEPLANPDNSPSDGDVATYESTGTALHWISFIALLTLYFDTWWTTIYASSGKVKVQALDTLAYLKDQFTGLNGSAAYASGDLPVEFDVEGATADKTLRGFIDVSDIPSWSSGGIYALGISGGSSVYLPTRLQTVVTDVTWDPDTCEMTKTTANIRIFDI